MDATTTAWADAATASITSVLAAVTTTAAEALTTAITDGAGATNGTVPVVEEPYNEGNYVVVSTCIRRECVWGLGQLWRVSSSFIRRARKEAASGSTQPASELDRELDTERDA